jgi:hypothetical protein
MRIPTQAPARQNTPHDGTRRRAPYHPRVDSPLLLPPRSQSGPETLAEYRARGGYQGLQRWRNSGTATQFLAEIAASGLRGRGGASFPTARKWQLAAAATATEKFVVANGGEHEPGSQKDRHLVEHHPHAVLEGLLLAGSRPAPRGLALPDRGHGRTARRRRAGAARTAGRGAA